MMSKGKLGEPFLTAVTTCLVGLSNASEACLACFAEGENCKQQKDPNFEKDAVVCSQMYSDQVIVLGKQQEALVDKLIADKITSEQYDQQFAIYGALQDASNKLMAACPYANCEAQNRTCTGIASFQNDHVVV